MRNTTQLADLHKNSQREATMCIEKLHRNKKSKMFYISVDNRDIFTLNKNKCDSCGNVVHDGLFVPQTKKLHCHDCFNRNEGIFNIESNNKYDSYITQEYLTMLNSENADCVKKYFNINKDNMDDEPEIEVVSVILKFNIVCEKKENDRGSLAKKAKKIIMKNLKEKISDIKVISVDRIR